MREVLVKNEEFKDSPLGKIPQDWDVLTFQQVSTVKQGLQIAISQRFKDYKPGRYVYITVEYLNNLDKSNTLDFIESPSSRVICHQDDVLVTRTGATGKIITGVEGVFHNNFFLVDYDKVQINKDFLVYYLNLEYIQKEIKFRAGTTTIPDLKHRDFYSLPFLKPPLLEQEKIAEILKSCDEAIARTSSLIIKLKQTKAGLLQDLLTRGLDEDGKLRDPQAHPEQFKDSALGRIPKDWDVSDVEIQFDITAGFTLGEHRRPRNNKRKYLRVANVHRDEILLDDIAELEAEDHELSSRLLEKDDLLIVEGHANPDEIGRCAIVPVEAVGLTFQNHLFRLRCKSLNPNFALAWLNSEWVRAYWRRLCGTSSGLNTINRTMLNAIFVPISTQDEQRKIVAIIDTYKRRIRTEEAYLKKLKLQKQGLMQDLLTGKVRVKNI